MNDGEFLIRDLVRADLLDAYILAVSKACKNYQTSELHEELRVLASAQLAMEDEIVLPNTFDEQFD